MQDNDNDSSVEPTGSPSPTMSQVMSRNPAETSSNQQRELGLMAIGHSISDGTKPASQDFRFSGAQPSSQTSYGDRQRPITQPVPRNKTYGEPTSTYQVRVPTGDVVPACPQEQAADIPKIESVTKADVRKKVAQPSEYPTWRPRAVAGVGMSRLEQLVQGNELLHDDMAPAQKNCWDVRRCKAQGLVV